MTHDPVTLTAELIKCESVTPVEGGALRLLDGLLVDAGFETTRIDRNKTSNLIAIWRGTEPGKVLGFNGHTDVVPVGEASAWSYPPFGATIDQGRLYGRGACDMKSGVACFVAAAIDHVQLGAETGGIIIMITGDEEGDALDGTIAILDWMSERQIRLDHCLVGEPTCPSEMGEMIKIGRRGSMTAWIEVQGKQGHSAYPHRAKNPNDAMIVLLNKFIEKPLDNGSTHFDPSSLAVTTIDVGNTATNVIPEKCRATLNIRFNDMHSGDSLSRWLSKTAETIAGKTDTNISIKIKVSGESFLTEAGDFTRLVRDAVHAKTGRLPELSTSGGTSDARFVKDYCPVVECGLVGSSMHQVDEFVEVDHILQLKDIYSKIIIEYFDQDA